MVVGYRACVLTPNVAELGRIARAVGLELPGRMSDAWLVHAPQVAQGKRVLGVEGRIGYGTEIGCPRKRDGLDG